MEKLLGIKEIAELSCTDNSKALNRSRVLTRIAKDAWPMMLIHKGNYLTAPRLYNQLTVFWSAIYFHLTEDLGFKEVDARAAMNGANGAIYNERYTETKLQDAVDGIAKGEDWCFTVQYSKYEDGESEFVSAAHPRGAELERFGSTSATIFSQTTINLKALFSPILSKFA